MRVFGCFSVLLLQCLFILFSIFGSNAEVVQITSENLDTVMQSNKLVFVNFYADWCRFSRMLGPIFSAASELSGKEFAANDIVYGRVDCDAEPKIAQKFSVNKYPTMKLFRHGVLSKREYRNQRTAEAINEYIRDQLKDPVTEVKNLDEIYELKREKRTIIGYFESKDTPQYQNFDSISRLLKDDCQFYVAIGDIAKPERTSGDNIIYRPIGENNAEMVFLGSLTNKDLLQTWTQDKCVPLVREITFKNGEELTEEGLPFLILFHSGEDTESLESYTKEVSRLVSLKSQINFLVADCETFSHPLHHLGKSVKDCPLVAIDSFRHMYMFPNFNEIGEKDKLKQFILDLQSGKLHREFHHGPDPTASKTAAQLKMDRMLIMKNGNVQYRAFVYMVNGEVQVKMEPVVINDNGVALPAQVKDEANKVNEEIKKIEQDETTEAPPTDGDAVAAAGGSTTIKSIFANLKPSQHRYTIVKKRDEL